MIDVIALTQDLIRCPSITPVDAGALDVLVAALEPLGFSCTRLKFGDVDNLFARRGAAGPHLCFAGHTDVVPPGDETAWRYPPFSGTIEGGLLYGRGASDMKGNIAAFISAVAALPEEKGSISLLITGDEEAAAIDGTVKVLAWMQANGQIPDACIVGEPTNPEALGDEIKIGRRGSLCATLTVPGVQGHVAQPHRADNPLPRLARMVDLLSRTVWDEGSAHFGPSTLQVTNIHVGNPAYNVIPGQGTVRFNIRFNDLWTPESLAAKIRIVLDSVDQRYVLSYDCNAVSFITAPGPLSDLVRQSVHAVTGRMPTLSTSGGTSDARFIQKYCPVVECGLMNTTIHKTDENVALQDLQTLQAIYAEAVKRFFQ